MAQFLASVRLPAAARRVSFYVIPSGGRNETRRAFEHAIDQHPEDLSLLLVDSESGVSGTPLQHLRRQKGWTLAGVKEFQVHLMAQMMEGWIVADTDALKQFYGQNFLASALPRATNLEKVPKADLARALAQATRDTSKGEYDKISHASRLLERIDPLVARERCPHCDRLFVRLEVLLTQ